MTLDVHSIINLDEIMKLSISGVGGDPGFDEVGDVDG
jgi:hypothetical protein